MFKFLNIMVLALALLGLLLQGGCVLLASGHLLTWPMAKWTPNAMDCWTSTSLRLALLLDLLNPQLHILRTG